MSFDLAQLLGVTKSEPVVRVVIADVAGSAPREVGASMLVTGTGTLGTIGGGALEFEAISRARDCLATGQDRLDRIPLGPGLGQCCGGAVAILSEVWDANRLESIDGHFVTRPLPGSTPEPPLAVRRLLTGTRGRGEQPSPQILSGWFVEPVSQPTRSVWIYGAGHVGRAIASVLAPFPEFEVTLIDTSADRFPDPLPSDVTPLVAAKPADTVVHAPAIAEHLVLTYSHALDLEISHRVLSRDFRALGLIGSDTKHARFRTRLAALGHTPEQIARLRCPIGDPSLGKHPQAIAVGVAASLLSEEQLAQSQEKRA